MNDIKNIFSAKVFAKNSEPKKSQSFYKDEIKSISAQLACLDTWFQIEDDSDLVDACIYQRESLIAKYRYFLKKSKENALVKELAVNS